MVLQVTEFNWIKMFFDLLSCRNKLNYSLGQNILGYLRKLGTEMYFAKLTHILPLKNAWGCSHNKELFLLSPSPPSSVDCVKLKLETMTSILQQGKWGKGRCLNLTSYCVSVPRALTRVVVLMSFVILIKAVAVLM